MMLPPLSLEALQVAASSPEFEVVANVGAEGAAGTLESCTESDCSEIDPLLFAALIAVTVKRTELPRVNSLTVAVELLPSTVADFPELTSLTT